VVTSNASVPSHAPAAALAGPITVAKTLTTSNVNDHRVEGLNTQVRDILLYFSVMRCVEIIY